MRLLLVDDSLEFLRVATQFLERDGTHQVVGQALDGRDAIELARALRPDVILVDFDMPAMTGVETVRRLKAELPDVRLIVVSGHGAGEYALQASRAGADGFVPKWRLFEELLPLLDSEQELN